MVLQAAQLNLERCPHCNVDTPTLAEVKEFQTTDHHGSHKRNWVVYVCARCGGAILTATKTIKTSPRSLVIEIYPEVTIVSVEIPEPARSYLQQAIDSLHSPAGSVMLSASAVDAMLKAKNYKEGLLYPRIKQAERDHLITPEMAQWAHEVRLEANFPRHADENAPLPTYENAKRCVDFTKALGEFLFVLPSRVKRGLKDATKPVSNNQDITQETTQ